MDIVSVRVPDKIRIWKKRTGVSWAYVMAMGYRVLNEDLGKKIQDLEEDHKALYKKFHVIARKNFEMEDQLRVITAEKGK